MSPQSAPSTATVETSHGSWVPMIAIAVGQMIISFNVAPLPVFYAGVHPGWQAAELPSGRDTG